MTQAGSIPPPPPKGQYHIWGFDPKGADKKSLTLAALIMEGFMKVIDAFKTSVSNSSAQLKKIDALMKDANALFGLINQVTSSKTTNLGALYTKIKSAIKTLRHEIYKIKDPNWAPPDKPPKLTQGSYLYRLNEKLSGVDAAITDKPFVSIFKNYLKMTKELEADIEKMWRGQSVSPSSFYYLVFDLDGVGRQLTQLETALKNKAVWGKGVPNAIKNAISDWNTWWSGVLNLASIPFSWTHTLKWVVTAHSAKDGISRAKIWIKAMSDPNGFFEQNPKAQNGLRDSFSKISSEMINEGNQVTVSTTTVLTWIRRMNGPDKAADWTWTDAGHLRGEMAGLWTLWTTGRSDSEEIINTTGTFSNETITDVNKGMTGISTVATVMAKMVNVPIRNVNRSLENLRKGL